jgi:crotonobetainyl-CoA:carnitine CoA-transferase CaiB-like acyl-CoA transferase
VSDSPTPTHYDILNGIRVVEVSTFVMAPSATTILADWGADVVKVEHPDFGDPTRGDMVGGLPPTPKVPVALMAEITNRGKRAMAANLAVDAGRELVGRLIAASDVFVTNMLPDARAKYRITLDAVRADNPDIVYALATGHGTRGPEAGAPGFDHTDFWARSGIGHAATQVTGTFIQNPGAGLGDLAGGVALAGGIAGALYRRATTGVSAVVDVSLLSTSTWLFSPSIVASDLYGVDTIPRRPHADVPSAFSAAYSTSDARTVFLAGVRLSDTQWKHFCALAGNEELGDDPRFASFDLRKQNRRELVAELDELFLTKALAEWCEILTDCDIAFSPVQSAREVLVDPQVTANNYVQEVEVADGTFSSVTSPVQFDGRPPTLTRAPEHGEHTDAIALELGYSWDEIMQLKLAEAIR